MTTTPLDIVRDAIRKRVDAKNGEPWLAATFHVVEQMSDRQARIILDALVARCPSTTPTWPSSSWTNCAWAIATPGSTSPSPATLGSRDGATNKQRRLRHEHPGKQ